MNRVTKQLFYGAFYALLWFGIFYSGYRVTLKPAPTCTDGILNQQEQEVDCGGPYCTACDIKKLSPIEIGPVRLLSATDREHVNAIVELRNPNVTYGADRFSFDLIIYGSSTDPVYTEHVVLPVYPSELKYRLFINVPVSYSPLMTAQATATDVSWLPLIDLSKPRTPIREVRMSIDAVTNRALITGIVQNDNAFVIHRVILSGLVSSGSGELVGVSKTVVQDLTPKEERFFQIVTPLAGTITDAALLDPRIYIEAER